MMIYRKARADVAEDVIIYYGDISRAGYESLTRVCASERLSETAYLVLATCGGDPHAGFRIARCLRHYYGKFKVIVPDLCKSAGTLITIGAEEVIIADRGELGPLDIQLSKPDEMLEQSSGMDIPQALEFLKQQTKATLSDLLWEIRVNRRLSTKMAAEIASKLTSSMFNPIYAQIDPIKLGETSRANAIGFEYGNRLNATANNLKKDALVRLITSYPSHSFVIDRKEAADLFQRVRAPNEVETGLLDYLYIQNYPIFNNAPIVYNLNRAEAIHDHEPSAAELSDASTDPVPDAAGAGERPGAGQQIVGGAE